MRQTTYKAEQCRAGTQRDQLLTVYKPQINKCIKREHCLLKVYVLNFKGKRLVNIFVLGTWAFLASSLRKSSVHQALQHLL